MVALWHPSQKFYSLSTNKAVCDCNELHFTQKLDYFSLDVFSSTKKNILHIFHVTILLIFIFLDSSFLFEETLAKHLRRNSNPKHCYPSLEVCIDL